ncbi:MAG: hypothetical protein J6T34_04975 [Bacilli bacterium]|nr:hypothetical protein [Bacilli bacterium]MBP5551362.1 hypothetical protein [Bacilli bacterium]
MSKKVSLITKYFIVVLVIVLVISCINVKASAPYVTKTVNRYGEIVETQGAYDPIQNIKSFEKAGVNDTFNSPQDLFIDKEDYFYVCDTGNKRVVILDKDWTYITEFGSDLLIKPNGIFVRNEYIYVTDFGDDLDTHSGKTVVYKFDKDLGTVTYDKTFGRPTGSLMEVDDFLYRPMKIAVDSNYTMYIVSHGSSNGVLLVNSENRFLNFFAPNSSTGNFIDLLRTYLYGENEKVVLSKKIAPAPENVMLDDSGYIYTVTQGVTKNELGDTLKKVNIGGLNFYTDEMIVSSSFVDTWSSAHKTVYAVSKGGVIYEYDIEGNLLFMFSGTISGDEQLGLFKSASSIAVNSSDDLYVVDDQANSIQVFRKTEFTNNVHQALELYMGGKYTESKELWEEVLRYNSMFDLAHKGIGMAYYTERDFINAMDKLKLANAKEQYSEAFWEARNIWLMNNITKVAIIAIVLIAGLIVVIKTNKKHHYLDKIFNPIKKFASRPTIKNILIMFKYIRHPFDAVYYVRYDKKIKIYNAFIVLALLLGIYLLSLVFTGFLFTDVVLERTILLKELTKVVLPIALFIVSNYLISSLMSGEGTFRTITINTMGSLMPIVIVMPWIILISNALTLNEGFLYYFPLVVMFIWSFILLFVVIKETHNFSVKQTIVNFLLTLFMMFVLVIVIILVYLVFAQLFGFGVDIFKEVIFRG